MTEIEIDRLCELTNIGAGHAATAFSQLAGRPIWMRVPRCTHDPAQGSLAVAATADADWPCGVFFEFEGGLAGVVGVLFREPMRESLARTLLGQSNAPHSASEVESAVMEVGNILVSQVASAIADTVGDRIVPSIPTLSMQHAEQKLEAMARRRCGGEPIRIECELTDDAGEIGGLLVLFPDSSGASK